MDGCISFREKIQKKVAVGKRVLVRAERGHLQNRMVVSLLETELRAQECGKKTVTTR